MAAVVMVMVVLAVVTAWTPLAMYPFVVSVWIYGLLCAGLGVWVHATIKTHWTK
jgi:hypothetical protein